MLQIMRGIGFHDFRSDVNIYFLGFKCFYLAVLFFPVKVTFSHFNTCH